MQKFSWRTMIIFVMVLFLGVILLGLGTAYVSKLKQERRQLSESFGRAFMETIFCADLDLLYAVAAYPDRGVILVTRVRAENGKMQRWLQNRESLLAKLG